jgi:hypothetical protein
MSSQRLHDRLRQLRARVAIRKWEIRQLPHAGGVWFRFELLLARTRRALAITGEEEEILRAAGIDQHKVGAELEPPKTIFVLSEKQLPASVGGQEVPLQELQQILAAKSLILIPFE